MCSYIHRWQLNCEKKIKFIIPSYIHLPDDICLCIESLPVDMDYVTFETCTVIPVLKDTPKMTPCLERTQILAASVMIMCLLKGHLSNEDRIIFSRSGLSIKGGGGRVL